MLRQAAVDVVPGQLRADIDMPLDPGRMAGMRTAVQRRGGEADDIRPRGIGTEQLAAAAPAEFPKVSGRAFEGGELVRTLLDDEGRDRHDGEGGEHGAVDLAAHLAVAVVEALWRRVDGVAHGAALAAATQWSHRRIFRWPGRICGTCTVMVSTPFPSFGSSARDAGLYRPPCRRLKVIAANLRWQRHGNSHISRRSSGGP